MVDLNDIKSRHVQQTERDRGENYLESADNIKNYIKSNFDTPNTPLNNIRFNRGFGKINVGSMFDGDSKYDKTITETDLFSGRSVEDLRAERQPWYSQLSNNLVNMGVIGATTFVDSYLGLAAGLVNMVFNPYEEGETDMNWAMRQSSKMADNPVSLWLNSIQKYTKKNFPTRTSDEYRQNMEEGKWWKNILTPEFIGETLVENAGFMGGIVASGKVSGMAVSKMLNTAKDYNVIHKGVEKALKSGVISGASTDDMVLKALNGKLATKSFDLDGAIAKAVSNINKKGLATKMTAGALAVGGEARIEAINAGQEFGDMNRANLDSPQGQQELAQKTAYELASDPNNSYMFEDINNLNDSNILQNIKPEYLEVFNNKVRENRELAEVAIQEGEKKVMGFTNAVNYPILYASSMWQFSKAFTGSYTTQKGFSNNLKAGFFGKANKVTSEAANMITKEGGKYVVKRSAGQVAKNVARKVSLPMAEGNEEMLQKVGSEAAMAWAGSKMNSFMGYQLDPTAEKEAISVLDALWNKTIETYTDPASYHEFFAGFVMGGIGAPIMFSKNSRGKRSMFEGGIYGDYLEQKSIKQDAQATVDAMNTIMEKNKEHYANIIRNNALENNKEVATEKDDKFVYLNNDHAQFISNLITFEKGGKLQDLIDFYQDNADKLSTSDKTEIAELAAELKEMTTNTETGKHIYGNKTDEEIVKEALKTNQKAVEKIKEYTKITNNLTTLLGDKFLDNDSFHEMVYLYSTVKDLEVRENELTQIVKDRLEKLKELKRDSKGRFTKNFEKNKYNININGEQKNFTLPEIIEQADVFDLMQFVFGTKKDEVYTPGDSYIKSLLEASQKEETKNLNEKEKLELLSKMFLDPESIGLFKTEIKDLNKIMNARAKLLNTYNQFLTNPDLLETILEADKKESTAKKEVLENQPLIDQIHKIKNVRELRQFIKDEKEKNPDGNIDNIIESMSDFNNNNYSKTVDNMKTLDNMFNIIENTNTYKNTHSEYKDLVKELYNRAKDRAESIEDLLDSSIYDGLANDFTLGNQTINALDYETILNSLINSLKEIKANEDRNMGLKKNMIAAQENRKASTELAGKNNFNPTAVKRENNQIQDKILESIKEADKNALEKLWANGVFEIDIDIYKEGLKDESGNIIHAPGTIILQKDSPDLSKSIYKTSAEFLESKGAFQYVNDGKLKKGSKIHFIASPEYWDIIGEQENNAEYAENNKPLLLVVEDENGSELIGDKKYQIVGTFKKELNTNLYDKVISEQAKDSENKHVSTENTSVNKVLAGVLEFKNEKELSALFSEGTDFKLAVAITDVELHHNLSEENPNILDFRDTKSEYGNAGRVYLLIKGADGKYIPVAVRRKAFNKAHLDNNSEFMNKLKNSLNKLSQAANSLDSKNFDNVFGELTRFLYIGNNAGIRVNLKEESNIQEDGVQVTEYFIQIKANKGEEVSENSESYELIIPIGKTTAIISEDELKTDKQVKDVDTIYSELIENLSNPVLNLNYQIDKKSVNTKWEAYQNLSYNQAILDAGILSVNLENSDVKGAFFYMNPLDENLKEKNIPKPETYSPSPAPFTPTPAHSNTDVEKGIYNNKEYIIDRENRVFIDKEGNKIEMNSSEGYKMGTTIAWNRLSQEEQRDRTILKAEIEDVSFNYSGPFYVIKGNVDDSAFIITDNFNKNITLKDSPDLYNKIVNKYKEKNSNRKKIEPVPVVKNSAEMNKTIETIQQKSKEYTLTEDGKFYADKQGKKYVRVTNAIEAAENGEKFDSNSPFALPSSMIGNMVDSVIKEQFKAEDIITDNLIIAGEIEITLPNGSKGLLPIAGTMDVLKINADNSVDIMDIKSQRSIYDPKSEYGIKRNNKYSNQLSLYAYILKTKYGIKVNNLSIIPIKVNYFASNSNNIYTEAENGLLLNNGNPVSYESLNPVQLEKQSINYSLPTIQYNKLSSEEKSLVNKPNVPKPKTRKGAKNLLTIGADEFSETVELGSTKSVSKENLKKMNKENKDFQGKNCFGKINPL